MVSPLESLAGVIIIASWRDQIYVVLEDLDVHRFDVTTKKWMELETTGPHDPPTDSLQRIHLINDKIVVIQTDLDTDQLGPAQMKVSSLNLATLTWENGFNLTLDHRVFNGVHGIAHGDSLFVFHSGIRWSEFTGWI